MASISARIALIEDMLIKDKGKWRWAISCVLLFFLIILYDLKVVHKKPDFFFRLLTCQMMSDGSAERNVKTRFNTFVCYMGQDFRKMGFFVKSGPKKLNRKNIITFIKWMARKYKQMMPTHLLDQDIK